jgi:hypothetical protein
MVPGLIRESCAPSFIILSYFVKSSVGRCDSCDVSTFLNKTLKDDSGQRLS